VNARRAVALVARREIRERVREKSFVWSTAVTIVIVLAVVLLGGVLGGGSSSYAVGVADPAAQPVAEAAATAAGQARVELTVERVDAAGADAALQDDRLDAVLTAEGVRAQGEPPAELLAFLQAANRQVRAAEALEGAGVTGAQARAALAPPPLRMAPTDPADEDAEGQAGLTFFVVLLLYGQLLTYGYWVAAGVVEEKASRVVEIVLSTIRPSHLLAGKVIGLGLLGLANLLLIGVVGLLAAAATGALEVDGDIVTAVGFALLWFLIGYAFYACAFAVAGALVPRQEELQSSTTPLTILILVAFFAAFAVQADPDGTLARVSSFLPFVAPMTMPPRIITGDVAAWEVAASLAVTIAATAILVPLAARIYAAGILRTGSALKLRDAWRASRA